MSKFKKTLESKGGHMLNDEEFHVVINDLAHRVLHGTWIQVAVFDANLNEYEFKDVKLDTNVFNNIIENHDVTIRPYLRPISSLTDEEIDKIFEILNIDTEDASNDNWVKINDVLGISFIFHDKVWIEDVYELFNYLFSIHVDINDLLKRKLALEPKKGMYEKL